MQIVRLTIAAALVGTLSPAWAGESDDQVLQAIRTAPSCHEAVSIANDATSGTEADVTRAGVVTEICQRDFLPGLDAARRAEYEGWRASCDRRSAKAGVVDRSAAASCAADVSERYSAEALAATGRSGGLGWSRYVNERFAYGVDVPPGFTPVNEAANSDGGTSGAVVGRADLAVWGANLVDTTFTADIRTRIDAAVAEGWVVGYKVMASRSATWSATKAGRIQYTRALAQCGDQTASLSIEYDADAKTALDPTVTRLARSLTGSARCGGRSGRRKTEAGRHSRD